MDLYERKILEQDQDLYYSIKPLLSSSFDEWDLLAEEVEQILYYREDELVLKALARRLEWEYAQYTKEIEEMRERYEILLAVLGY